MDLDLHHHHMRMASLLAMLLCWDVVTASTEIRLVDVSALAHVLQLHVSLQRGADVSCHRMDARLDLPKLHGCLGKICGLDRWPRAEMGYVAGDDYCLLLCGSLQREDCSDVGLRSQADLQLQDARLPQLLRGQSV